MGLGPFLRHPHKRQVIQRCQATCQVLFLTSGGRVHQNKKSTKEGPRFGSPPPSTDRARLTALRPAATCASSALSGTTPCIRVRGRVRNGVAVFFRGREPVANDWCGQLNACPSRHVRGTPGQGAGPYPCHTHTITCKCTCMCMYACKGSCETPRRRVGLRSR